MTREYSERAEPIVSLWRFVRGDFEARDFERWACESRDLEARLGSDWYMDVISAD
jgi:hypothetical protein